MLSDKSAIPHTKLSVTPDSETVNLRPFPARPFFTVAARFFNPPAPSFLVVVRLLSHLVAALSPKPHLPLCPLRLITAVSPPFPW